MAITDIRVVQFMVTELVDTETGPVIHHVPKRHTIQIKRDGGDWEEIPIVHVQVDE